ncbi:MAG: hypothetical protein AB3N10_04835 [Allomuricauda sp.]
MNEDAARALLKRVLDFIDEIEPGSSYGIVSSDLGSEGLESFLKSNSLWGGAGSIADQAGLQSGKENRRKLESMLIELGEFQIAEGIVNERTQVWTEVFKYWKTIMV